MTQTALWVTLVKNNRIIGQQTEPCLHDGAAEALNALCSRMDLSRPVWLDKNRRDWESFSRTRFMPDQFIDPVVFDRMEIEFINPEAPPVRNRDPRNG